MPISITNWVRSLCGPLDPIVVSDAFASEIAPLHIRFHTEQWMGRLQ